MHVICRSSHLGATPTCLRRSHGPSLPSARVNSIWAGTGTIVTGTPAVRKGILFLIMIWAAICSQMSGNAFVSHYLSPEEISNMFEGPLVER